MKTKTLLFLASLAVLATSARAASTQKEPEIVVLPTYVVAAPRELPLQQRITTSLDELRERAQKAITAELVAVRAQAQDKSLVLATQLARVVGAAKL